MGQLNCDEEGAAPGRRSNAVNIGRLARMPRILRSVSPRLAYVAVSRGQYDARIYTDDKLKLPRALGRDVSHRSALERTPEQMSRQSEAREISRSDSIGHTMAVGPS